MTKDEFLIEKLHKLVRVAYGCTEIGAIAYPCAAAAAQMSKNDSIESLKVEISSYIYKNVSRVGVPNLGFCGVSMIAATGAMVAKPERKLEMFSTVSEEEKEAAKELCVEKRVKVVSPENVDPVYAKATIVTKKGDKIEALVEGFHDNLVYVKKNGKTVFTGVNNEKVGDKKADKEEYGPDDFHLTDLIALANELKEKDLAFLEDVFKINVELSEYGKKNVIPGSFTDIFIKTYDRTNDVASEIILDTAAAIDARMAGVPLPVMSSCGSGDHGLTLSIPQYTFHKHYNTPKVTFLRALALANLVTWKIKSAMGELSAFCGSISAACTATLAGLGFQANFSSAQIRSLISSCMASYALALCDGAKMSCTFKIAAALGQGVMLFRITPQGFSVKPKDGIIGETPRQTLKIFHEISHKHSKDINATLVKGLNEINNE